MQTILVVGNFSHTKLCESTRVGKGILNDMILTLFSLYDVFLVYAYHMVPERRFSNVLTHTIFRVSLMEI